MKKIIQQIILVVLLVAATFTIAQSPVTLLYRERPQKTDVQNFSSTAYDNNSLAQVTVKTIKMGIINYYFADCYYSISGSPISESGVCWSTKPNPTYSNSKCNTPKGNPNLMSALLNNLQASTTYYVRAYVKSGNEVIYGNEISFTTKPKPEKTTPNQGKKTEQKETPQKGN